jgi:hypothetical protein
MPTLVWGWIPAPLIFEERYSHLVITRGAIAREAEGVRQTVER